MPFQSRSSLKEPPCDSAELRIRSTHDPSPSIRVLSASTMTGQRQEGNRRYQRSALFASFAGFLSAILVSAAPLASQATITERVVMNRFTGLAIEGFDPVAYFVDGRPLRGLPDFEATLSGAVW